MRLLTVLLVLLVAPLVSRAQTPEGITTSVLENGMQVVVIEDHRAPVITHMLWYKVGAADDPPGKSGLAHFLEHLLFKGTAAYPGEEFQRIITANGGSDNAFTSWDYTGYYQRVAANRLGLMMELEADRMKNLILTRQDVAVERDVILEERNSQVESGPSGPFFEQMAAALYLAHPYGRPIIGWRHEMETLALEDAMAFYRAHYAPDNAILIVAGDADPQEVFALARQHYGPLEPSGLSRAPRPQEPPHVAARRVIYEDARVRQPYLSRSYLAPTRSAGNQGDAAALSVLARLLGGGVTGHLYQTLQLEEGVALNAGAGYSALGLDPRSFGVYAVPADGVSLETLEDRLDAALTSFIETGPDADDLGRIKAQMRAGRIYQLDNQGSRARGYGAALTSGLTLQDIEAWPDLLDAVTAEDVMRVARMIFVPERATTGTMTAPSPEAPQ